MGNAGIGSISHLTLLLFNDLTGADLIHVPYRGLSEATNDLLGGQIDTLFDQVVTATPHIVNDTENPIVVTIPTRSPSIPNVPSSTEAGLPEPNRRLDGAVRAQRHAEIIIDGSTPPVKKPWRYLSLPSGLRNRRRRSSAGPAVTGCASASRQAVSTNGCR